MGIAHYAFRLSPERLMESIADLGPEPKITIDRPSRTMLWCEELCQDAHIQEIMSEIGGFIPAELTDILRGDDLEYRAELVANLLIFGAVLRGEGLGFGICSRWQEAINSGLDERFVRGHKFADTSLARLSAAGRDAGTAVSEFFANVHPLSVASRFGFLESDDLAIVESERSKSDLSAPILQYLKGVADSLSSGYVVLLVLSG